MTESWDRDLSEREIERLAPGQKGKRSRASLERKVRCLETWCNDPLLVKINVERIPWKRPALRKWQDSSMGLWSWKFSPVDHPEGDNSDLMKRYFDAIKILRRMIDGVSNAEIDALKHKVASLEKQNLALLDQILQLQKMIPARSPRR